MVDQTMLDPQNSFKEIFRLTPFTAAGGAGVAAVAIYAVTASPSEDGLMLTLAAAFAGMLSLTLSLGMKLLQDLEARPLRQAFPVTERTCDDRS
ncbi:hypothetical protein ACVNHC_08940 [Pannonibacter sp. Q-1]|mgnify:CR=1 FL=1|uniref:Uncharacterized protein n=1 Tax=Pannonibacter phragmitetus TaxID=121719 RepID=A0A0L0ITD3_9HYPH|nr:hypothetical protein [Pannonibacter phragmitetus]ALV27996.1 hypothetical protein APZ00_13730 [Pannonibacter phragmitetus]KND16781.1 hypothetical protein ADZ37_21375 [Pannonibacter phragmitetus]MBA4203860.1 hypothetical protein [Polymorphum sp.]